MITLLRKMILLGMMALVFLVSCEVDPPPVPAPVANAGPDQNVTTGALVTLDGSQSSAADGATLTYNWLFVSRPAGSAAALSSTTAVSPTFTADASGSFRIRLVVNDGRVDSAADTVTVMTTAAPVAHAGPDQNVTTGALVTLDGSLSSAAGGAPLTYNWSFVSRPAGSAAALSSTTAVRPTFTADASGSYRIRLVVNDGRVDSEADTVTVTARAMTWASVSAGRHHTVAIRTDGTLWAWGHNTESQLGDGTNINRNSPVPIGTATNWASVSAGGSHTLAIRTDGTLWAWGHNAWGQLGLGHTTLEPIPIPTQVGAATNWAFVAAGCDHTLAIRTDGTLWAWGYNWNGQLGLGVGEEGANRDTPTLVGAATTWSSVFVGREYTMAIKTDGTLWAWGENWSGQLGDGSITDRWSPVLIGTATNWASVSAGECHTLALRTDGTLWAWGRNEDGRLGDGTSINRFSPVPIGTGANWASVYAGGWHTLAIRTDGTLWAWGRNMESQLGDGSITERWSPVPIGTATNWASVAAGDFHTLAIRTDGTLWAWGRNERGQLGDGTNTDRNSPVQIQ